jgi:hypothetical protein
MIGAWQLLRLSLIGLIAGGTALSVALALGAADPPRHSALYSTLEALEGALELPAPPFTLIAHGAWRESASPLDSWHLLFTDGEGAIRLRLSLHGDGSFSLAPIQADAHGFIHLRRPPETNEIWLYVTENEAILRLNREIAWQGALPHASEVRIESANALRSASIRLYTP